MQRFIHLAAVAVFMFGGCGIAEVQQPAPLRIADAVVTLSEQVDVPARSIGVLAELSVQEGDLVKKGQAAARIDDREAQLAVKHAELDLASAKSEAANELRIQASEKATAAAKAELQRAKESSAKYSKSISETELDRLRFTAEKSELEHLQARHERDLAQLKVQLKENELDAAQHKWELHRLTVPADGVVVEIKRRPGEWVEPGMPVLRIVTMDPLRVEAFLDARRASPKLAGATVRFLGEADGSEPVDVEGKITFVSPEIDPINGQVRIWALIPNADRRLRPGLQGVLEVVGPAAVNRKTAVPQGAR